VPVYPMKKGEGPHYYTPDIYAQLGL